MKVFNFFLILKTVYSCFDQSQIANNSSLIIHRNDVYDISNYNGTLNFTNDSFNKMKIGIICKDETEPTSFNETTKRPKKTKTTTQRLVTTVNVNVTTTQKLTTILPTTILPTTILPTNETTSTTSTILPTNETTSTSTTMMDEYQILLNDDKRIVCNNMLIMIGCLSYILLF